MRSTALALAFVVLPAQAQTPTLTAHAPQDEVSVGEPFRVELRGSAPAGTLWNFPEQAGNDDVELLREPVPSPSPGASPTPPRPSGTEIYRAAVFAVKDVAVPPVTARYTLPDGTTGEATSASLPLQLRSLLPKDERERALGDVQAPLPLDVRWPFWATLFAALLVIVALGAWFVRRRRRTTPRADALVPALAPDVEALRALDALASPCQLTRGDWRLFYIALAEVAKRYLERRLDAPVLEMTSTETLAFLRGHVHGDALLGTARDLMGAADQVKFARGEGQAVEAARHLEAARGLIATLEARLRPEGAGLALPTTGGAR